VERLRTQAAPSMTARAHRWISHPAWPLAEVQARAPLNDSEALHDFLPRHLSVDSRIGRQRSW